MSEEILDDCTWCFGLGVCPDCEGDGCENCDDGDCPHCDGTGEADDE